MELTGNAKSITLAEISNFEKSYELKLPKSFIDFYLNANGGSPSTRYFEDYRIAAFCPIKHKPDNYNIEKNIEILKLSERLPEGFIPFAFDSGGWFFCLDTSERNYGSIYILPNGMLDSDPIFIVSSFSKFIDGLSDEEY